MKTTRLDKFLSECGLCTRSESKVLLKKGAVTVNGEKICRQRRRKNDCVIR